MRYMVDYHVHTDFSSDCEMPMEEACQAARKIGIKEIAFTEHLDVIYPKSDLEWDFNVEQYTADIARISKDFADVKIVKGIEVGIHPSGYQQSREFTAAGNFDFVIGSIHVVEDKDLHGGEFFNAKSVDEVLEEYFLTVNKLVEEYQDFNVLGHLDLVKRYLKYLNCSWHQVNMRRYFDVIENTLQRLIDTGRGIELNMSGYRYGINCSHPDADVLRLYRQLGGEIITIGSDAHRVDAIGFHYDLAVELLAKANFKYVTTFERRQPSYHKLR